MLLLAALAASGQAGPRDGSGSDEAAGHHSLRHWLSGLTISWPDTTVVVTSPERDPRGGHPLYVTISGAVCSKSHIEAVRSEFLDGHLSSEAEASSELYVAVDHFGVECEVSRVLVEQEPPARSGSMLVPLQLGEKLYLDLYSARNWPTGVTFTLSDASVATRLRLFTVGEERLPDLDLIDTQLDLRPEHLSVSLHGVGLPLPGADLLANTALSAVMLGWGAAERLDYSGLLSSMLSSSLRAAFAEQVLPAQVAQVHAFLAALAAADGKLSRPEPPLPPEALRWRESAWLEAGATALNTALGGVNGTSLPFPPLGRTFKIIADGADDDGEERPALGINRLARLIGGENGTLSGARHLPATLGHEQFVTAAGGLFNLSVEATGWSIHGLDSFERLQLAEALDGEEDAHSLAWEVGLSDFAVEASVTFRLYVGESGVFSHPSGRPLEIATSFELSLADVGASGALLLGLNATRLASTQLWQLTQPRCLSKALLAAGMRRLQFSFSAARSSIAVTPCRCAHGDALVNGITGLITDAARAGLSTYDSIIEGVVSGLVRAPLVSAINNFTSALLTYPGTRGGALDDSCEAPPPEPRRADWRSPPESADVALPAGCEAVQPGCARLGATQSAARHRAGAMGCQPPSPSEEPGMARIAAVAMEGVSLAITASRSSSCGTPPPLEAMGLKT